MPDNPRIEELRRRVQKDPASIAFAQLAEEYRRAGNYDEAVEVCRSGLEKHPSYLSARVTLGRALIELERFDEAKTELQTVLRTAPENLAAIRGLAEIHQRHGDLGEALRQYQSALGIAKHDPDLEESVHELSRQLGTPPPEMAPPPVPAAPPAAAPAFAASPIPELVEPPPIPIDFTFGAASEAEAVVAAPEPVVALPPPFALTSSELEAAADEFTKALEALDALSIDIPTPSLGDESLDLTGSALADGASVTPSDPEVAIGDGPDEPPVLEAAAAVEEPLTIDEPDAIEERPAIEEPRAMEAVEEEPALAAAVSAPTGNKAFLNKLESWLDAIVLDRESRASRA